MKCVECGAEIKDGAIYCIKCGAMQVSTGVDPARTGERIQMGRASEQKIDWPDLEPASADANNAVKGVNVSESAASAGRHMKDFHPAPKRTGRNAAIVVAVAAVVAAAIFGGGYLLNSSAPSASSAASQVTAQTASSESSDESSDSAALTASTSASSAAADSTASASASASSAASTSSTASASSAAVDTASSSAAAEPIPTIVEEPAPAPAPAPEPAPEPEPAPAPEPEPEVSNDYVLGDSSSRYYSREELESMSAEELSYARNEIYARNGRIFQRDDLQSYFESQDWYEGSVPADQFNSETMLSDVELANVLLIKDVEQSKGYL